MVLHAPVIMMELNINAPKTQQGIIVMKVNLCDNYNRVYIYSWEIMPHKMFVIYSFCFPGNSTDQNSAIYGMDGLNGTQIYFIIYLLGGLCGVILCTVILGFSIAIFLWSKKLKKKRENEFSGVLSSF